MASLVRRRSPGDLVFLVAVVIAVILVAHIIFFWLGANPANDIVKTAASWAGWLGTWFDDLFEPANEKLEVFLDYGLAALVFLVIGGAIRTALNRA